MRSIACQIHMKALTIAALLMVTPCLGQAQTGAPAAGDTTRPDADARDWTAGHTPVLGDSQRLRQARLFRFDRGERLMWSPDGSTIIGKSGPGLILFDAAGGQPPVRSAPLAGTLHAVTPDGRTIVERVDEGTRSRHLAQVDTGSFGLVRTTAVPGETQHVALAFDGRSALFSIASARRDGLESSLVAYDLEPNELRPLPFPTFPRGSRRFAMIAADAKGPRVVFLHHDSIIVWNYERGETVLTLKPEGWTKDMTSVTAAFSSDGSRLFVAADGSDAQSCEVTAWAIESGERLAAQRLPGQNARLSVSSDGRHVGLACDRALAIWDAALAGRVETLSVGENARFGALAFSPDARSLAVHVADTSADVDGALVVYAVTP